MYGYVIYEMIVCDSACDCAWRFRHHIRVTIKRDGTVKGERVEVFMDLSFGLPLRSCSSKWGMTCEFRIPCSSKRGMPGTICRPCSSKRGTACALWSPCSSKGMACAMQNVVYCDVDVMFTIWCEMKLWYKCVVMF